MPITSKGTQLKWGTTAANVAQVVKIKSFPDLGSAPSAIETTDLESESQEFINGIIQSGILEFTANYGSSDFEDVLDDAETALYYALDLGGNGVFVWQGQHTVMCTGAGVDGVIEMKISIAPSTKIFKIPNLLTVTIPGTPQVSHATSALTKTYTDTPLETPTFTYQWKISSTSNGTYANITGATSATYSPVVGDVGKYLKCQVTATVQARGTVLSGASAQIIAA